MRLSHAIVASISLWFAASPVQAQTSGPYARPFGAYPYGYLGYFPGAYGSSWSNGRER